MTKNNHSWAMDFLLMTANKIKKGSVTLHLPHGETHHFRGTEAGRQGELTIHDLSVAKKLLSGGMIGFNEAYDDGLVDSPDLYQFYSVILGNQRAIGEPLSGKWWFHALNWIIHQLRPNTRDGARKNISAHYDLGNDFYAAWLDPSMTYSSGLYHHDADDLYTTQQNKYKHLAEMLDIQPHHTILEIGCGWGGFAEYIAQNIGASVTAITISQEQFIYAQKRLEAYPNISVQLVDYRDVTGQFDRIVSIEMFEAVGEKYWPIYFKTLYDRLRDGGKAGLQIITIEESRFDRYRKKPDYIQKYIFPGGMLPTVGLLHYHTDKAGLEWGHAYHFGHDYARTLQEWNNRFQTAWPSIQQLPAANKYDTRFKRMWEQYLAYCAAGFTCDTIDVIQCVLEKPTSATSLKTQSTSQT